MATRVIDDTKLQNIAVAIQGKDSGGQMTVDEMPTRIAAIPTGDEVLFSSNGRQYTRTVEIPNNVTTIGDNAFQGCSLLETIDLNNVTTVGGSAFQSCTELTEVIFPDSLTEIGANAFSNCIGLIEIDLKNVRKLGGYAFNDCSFRRINTNNVTNIGDAAFRYCHSLEIAICKNATTMGEQVFWRDERLKYVDCRNIAQIKNQTFYSCWDLRLIDLTSRTTLTALSNVSAFQNTNNTWIAVVANDTIKSDFQNATNWSTFASHFRTIAEVEAEVGMTYDEYYYQLFGEPRNEVTP